MNKTSVLYPNENEFNEKIWGIDVGTSSLGIAVRDGLDFPYVRSNLIPEDFA